MTQKQIILEQLAACHDRNGWFVAMSGALAGLDAAQAARSAGPSSHSVWQILYHVTYWNERSLKRLRGEDPGPVVSVNEESFGPSAGGGETEWRALQDEYDRVMKELVRCVQDQSEEKLQSPVSADAKEIWYGSLANLTLHAAHHIGQIVTLRKLQGSWDSKQGVS